ERRTMRKVFLVTTILATLASVANSHGNHQHAPIASPSLAPAPKVDCSSIIYDMASCISFISKGSKDTKPEADCCNGYESVLNYNPDCICEAIKSSAQLGVDLNMTKATALPSACGVSAPSMSQCGSEYFI
ncbi:LTP_2 domain-containing protein, partial [Cephalotus follicularis]